MRTEVPSRNVELVQRYLADHSPEFIAEDARFHDMATGEEVHGADAIGAHLYDLYHVAFPGAAAADPVFHEGERSVTLEFRFSGVNSGPFAGSGPTDREVSVPMCVIYQIESNRIQRISVYYDAATMLRQLGMT